MKLIINKILFQKLYPGSSFHFISSLLWHYSLFQFEAIISCTILEVEVDEIKKLSHQDYKLMDVLNKIKSEVSIQGSKYDYSYWNILKKQQSTAEQSLNSVKLLSPPMNKNLSLKVTHQQFDDMISDSRPK